VRDELKKLGMDPESVAAVFLTHSDTDHRED
jgi:metal-dependent hydrolase (beta-lactamase superfamily II)